MAASSRIVARTVATRAACSNDETRTATMPNGGVSNGDRRHRPEGKEDIAMSRSRIDLRRMTYAFALAGVVALGVSGCVVHDRGYGRDDGYAYPDYGRDGYAYPRGEVHRDGDRDDRDRGRQDDRRRRDDDHRDRDHDRDRD
jgi:hypothetical protein